MGLEKPRRLGLRGRRVVENKSFLCFYAILSPISVVFHPQLSHPSRDFPSHLDKASRSLKAQIASAALPLNTPVSIGRSGLTRLIFALLYDFAHCYRQYRSSSTPNSHTTLGLSQVHLDEVWRSLKPHGASSALPLNPLVSFGRSGLNATDFHSL